MDKSKNKKSLNKLKFAKAILETLAYVSSIASVIIQLFKD